jgi:hypothetical protein
VGVVGESRSEGQEQGASSKQQAASTEKGEKTGTEGEEEKNEDRKAGESRLRVGPDVMARTRPGDSPGRWWGCPDLVGRVALPLCP